MRGRFYWLTLLVLISDHLTKWIVAAKVPLHDAVVVIPGFLQISHVRNEGVAFGLFADIQSVWKPYILAGMAVAAVIVIVIYSMRAPSDRILLRLALAVTMGGILGNFTDRLIHKYVVDFIEFHIRNSFHWPTFNLADTAITVGIAMLLIDTLRNPDDERQEQPAGGGTQ